jgi:hypothetical protein
MLIPAQKMAGLAALAALAGTFHQLILMLP